MRTALLLGATLGLLVGACFSDEGGGEECEPGTEGCVCTTEGECIPPLECRSDLCVAPDDTGTTTEDTTSSDTTSSDTTDATSSGSSGGTTTASETTGGTTTSTATTSDTGTTTTTTTSDATSDTGTTTTTPTATGPCGNGVLDPDEECDPMAPAPYGEDACSSDDCTLLYFECNPLRDMCPGGWKCRDATGPPPNTECAQSDDATDVGQPCTTTQECVRGSICIGGDIDCNNASGCCVAWCDTELVPDACPNQLECMSWWQFLMQPAPSPGLDHLGICRPP